MLLNRVQENELTQTGKFASWQKLHFFAALLKEVPIGCKDVLPNTLLKSPSVIFFTFEESTQKPYNDNNCLFKILALYIYGNERHEQEISNLVNYFLKKTGANDPANNRSVCMEVNATVQSIIQVDIFLYDVEIVDGSMRWELVRSSVGKNFNTVGLFYYISHLCSVSIKNALFKTYHCPSYGHFIKRAYNLEWQSTICNKRLKNFPKNVHQTTKKRFDKVDSFAVLYTDNQKFFKNMALFGFGSICVQEDNFHETDTITWIGKHVSIYVSISSNLIELPLFYCNSNPKDLGESFVVAFDGLATQCKTHLKLRLQEIKTSVESKLNPNFSHLNQHRCRNEPVMEYDDGCIEEAGHDVSTQFLQTQKNHIIDLKDHFKRDCSVLPVFRLNNAKYDITLKKSFLYSSPR